MFETVRRALGRPERPEQVHECRHCGTSPPPTARRCPVCDSTEIAIYEL